jgi:hypothetical protein
MRTCDSGAGANATLMPEIAGRPQVVINYIVDIDIYAAADVCGYWRSA